jgi:hypothetical protein
MPGVVGVPPEPASAAAPDELPVPEELPEPDELCPLEDPAPELELEVAPEPLDEAVPPPEPELVAPPLPPPDEAPEGFEPLEALEEEASSPVGAPFPPPPGSPPPGVELHEVRSKAAAKSPEAVTRAHLRMRIVVMASERWRFLEPIARADCTRACDSRLEL